MKLIALLRGDVRVQFKYGFYLLYLFFALFYIGLLAALPQAWRQTAAVLMVFSDPAALGLFFMGALVLFEKSERVLDSLAVAPIKVRDYVLSKLLSLALISTLVALMIGAFGDILTSPLYFLAGVLLGSCLFSALGLMVAVRIATLNEFIIFTVPIQIAANIPAVAYIAGWQPVWLLLHPGVCMIELFNAGPYAPVALLVLTAWTIPVVLFTGRVVKRAFASLGGVKL
jgi:fluoroquinolone transport system permease protein